MLRCLPAVRGFLVFLLLPGVVVAAAAAPGATEILAQAMTASGGAAWNRVRSLRASATIESGGLSGKATEFQDLEKGRFSNHYSMGGLKGGQGFDGRTGWILAPGGEVTPIDSPVDRRTIVNAAYVTARAWWFPRRWPASISLAAPRKTGVISYQVLDITPRGGRELQLWVDAKTHLIARIVEATGLGTSLESTYFSDYHTVNGIRLPFRQRYSRGKKQYDTIVRLHEVTLNGPVDTLDFAMPRQHLRDFSFVGGGGKATIPFSLINNHIYLAVTVNGHPLQFMLDTGAMNLLTRAAAKDIGLAGIGALQGAGAGNGTVREEIGKVENLTLGGKVTLRNQIFVVVPMPGFSNVEGTHFDGLLGYQLLERFVVKIDYADRSLTLMRARDFAPATAGAAVPFTFLGYIPGVKGPKAGLSGVGHIPGISGSIDGLSGEFEVDTGSRDALILWAPFAEAHDLATRYHASPETVVAWGVGGSANGMLAHGGTLLIGNIAVHDPLIDLSAAKQGARFIAGNIGGEILRQFTITFDYADQVLYLQPNRHYGEPMNYDRSGMWINAAPGGLAVKSVMPHGPAYDAGLKVGDLITAVDGEPAVSLTLSGVRRMLSDEASGRRVRLTVGRGKAARTATLVLRNLF